MQRLRVDNMQFLRSLFYFADGSILGDSKIPINITNTFGFYTKFHRYFDYGSIDYKDIFEYVGTLGLEYNEEIKILRKIVRENRKDLYNW